MTKQIIDIREPYRFKEGHLPHAINIPHNYISDQIEKLDKNNEILLYCQDGKKSHSIETYLKTRGYNAKSIGAYPILKQNTN